MFRADHTLNIWELWGEILAAMAPVLVFTVVLFVVVVTLEIRAERRYRRTHGRR